MNAKKEKRQARWLTLALLTVMMAASTSHGKSYVRLSYFASYWAPYSNPLVGTICGGIDGVYANTVVFYQHYPQPILGVGGRGYHWTGAACDNLNNNNACNPYYLGMVNNVRNAAYNSCVHSRHDWRSTCQLKFDLWDARWVYY